MQPDCDIGRLGYADQAHLARELKAAIGQPPAACARTSAAAVRSE